MISLLEVIARRLTEYVAVQAGVEGNIACEEYITTNASVQPRL